MATQRDDISGLKTDVAVLKRDVKYVVEGVKAANSTLSQLRFVGRDEYEEFKKTTEAKLADLEKVNKDNAVGNAFSNLFASNVFQYIIGAILAAAVFIAARVVSK